jgi:AbrB family looped-hinge helix DNA binding protein
METVVIVLIEISFGTILCLHPMTKADMKKEARIRVTKHGEILIPAAFRKAMGIRVGDAVVLRLETDELSLSTLKQRIERAQRLLRKYVKPGTSLVDELIAERRGAPGRT